MRTFKPCSSFYLLSVCLFVVSCSLTPNTTNEESLDVISEDIIALAKIEKLKGNNLQQKETEVLTENIKAIETVSTKQNPLGLYNVFLLEINKQQVNLTPEVKVLYKKAIAAMQKKSWRLAEGFFDEVFIVAPDFTDAYVNRALMAYQQQKYMTAISFLGKAETKLANNPYVFNLKGIVYRASGELELAEKSYLKAIKIWPEYTEAHLNFAVFSELYRGNFVKAKQHYETYLRFKPNDKQVQRWLAGLNIKLAAR